MRFIEKKPSETEFFDQLQWVIQRRLKVKENNAYIKLVKSHIEVSIPKTVVNLVKKLKTLFSSDVTNAEKKIQVRDSIRKWPTANQRPTLWI